MANATQRLMKIADATALTLAGLALASMIFVPFAASAIAEQQGVGTNWLAVAIIEVISLLTGIGAFLLTRHRPLGLLITLLPAVAWLVIGAWPVAIAYLVLHFLLIDLAYLKVMQEAR
ncbi:hypothetical protein [Salinibius halmophilus]|uniref:hypothetical protein n=1 Tax=Salinibius halmophilus TaxID=1853216 RepID=UPI000E66991F|nr:hypothetical protein [Salinibius halmophilus]